MVFLLRAALYASLLFQSIANPVPKIKTRYAPYSLGAVASESDICSRIGVTLLQAGGNAADASVGTVFCVGVVGMYHSGLGGGGFALIRAPNGSFEFYDFRETAPAAASQDMYNSNVNLSIFGGLASGVPGQVRGLAKIHSNYGKLPWKQVLQPSIDLARNGFPVNQDLVNYIKSANGSALNTNFFINDPAWAVDYAPNGTIIGLGDTLVQDRLATTLATIAEFGPDAFYTGPIAEYTIKALQAQNGTMTLEDLANYTVAVRRPVTIKYRGYNVTSCSAPSSGAIVLSALNTLSGYANFMTPANLNLSTHLMDEAIRFGYGQRTDFGDPSFVANMSRFESEILLPSTGTQIRSRINFTQTLNVSAYDPSGFASLDTPGTSQISTADGSGLAVSLTTTINLIYGSNLIVPETGVIMNNEMNDFSIPGSSNAFGFIPSPSNYIRPGKRPQSSMSPSIIELPDGRLYIVVGSAGGSRIITANIQNIIHMLDQNMTAQQALAQPRLHDQLVPNRVTFEYAYNNQTTAYMASLGCNITWVAPGLSTAGAVRLLPNGSFEAAREPRLANSGAFAV